MQSMDLGGDAPLRRVERRAQPLDPVAVDGDDIEAARRRPGQATQEVHGREDDALPFCRADACRRAAEALIAPRAHFDEDERAVAVAHHEVDLAALGPRPACDPIIALHQHQPGPGEMGERP